MAKITKHEGPTLDPGVPLPEGPQTPADVLRSRGKLGPYPTPPSIPADGEVWEGDKARQAEQEHESEGDGVEREGVDVPDGETGTLETEETETSELERPATSAPKAEWVAYVAELTGQNPADVEQYTKAQLVEQYGG